MRLPKSRTLVAELQICVQDYVISIATIHHLSTHERRKAAVQGLIRAVSPAHGRVLIYVWATEQDELSKRSIPLSEGKPVQGEDVFVPWVMSKEPQAKPEGKKTGSDTPDTHGASPQTEDVRQPPQVFNRYYHMFARGELDELVHEAAKGLQMLVGPPEGSLEQGIEIVQDGWERSNYYVELRRWQSS